MTIFVHGKEEYDKISNVSDIIFCNNDFDNLLKIKDIEIFLKNIKNISIQKNEILSLNTYYDLLCTVSIPHVFTSKSNIKRCLEEKSVYINKKRIENIDEKIDNNIFSNKFFIIQHGKKKYFVVFMI
jgi:tyrosyl-tRNA synthetase